MRNFFPFLPTIPFGNQKMKILETKNQKVDMDMHNSKLFNFVWKTILSNFCNYPFANSMSIFGFLKVFFSTIGHLTIYFHLTLRFYQKTSRDRGYLLRKIVATTLRVSRLFILCFWISNVCVHIALPHV